MKLLHAADLQIGAQRKIPGYLERQKKALRELASIAREEQVDAVLLVGDIFEHCRPAQEEIDLVLWFLDQVDESLRIPVIILVGNHEYTHRSLQGYHALKTVKLIQHRFEALEVIDDVTVLEYPEFVVVGIPPSKTNEDELDRLSWPNQKALSSGKPIVLLLHVTLQGSVFRGMPQDKGFNPGLLDSCGVSYIALGDIHQRQKANCSTPAYYPGSLIQKDFGEDAETCGVLIVELGPKKVSVRERRLTLPETLRDYDIPASEFKLMADRIPENCLVKITVRGSGDELRDLKIPLFEKALAKKRSRLVDLQRRVLRSMIDAVEDGETLTDEEVISRFQDRLLAATPEAELQRYIREKTWRVDADALVHECSSILGRVENYE